MAPAARERPARADEVLGTQREGRGARGRAAGRCFAGGAQADSICTRVGNGNAAARCRGVSGGPATGSGRSWGNTGGAGARGRAAGMAVGRGACGKVLPLSPCPNRVPEGWGASQAGRTVGSPGWQRVVGKGLN